MAQLISQVSVGRLGEEEGQCSPYAMNAKTIGQLLERTTRAVYEKRGPKEVHQGQWAVLRYLSAVNRELRSVGKIAAHLGVTHAPASRAVASLARKGHVTVGVDSGDRRMRRIDLTVSGQALLDQDPTHRLTSAIESLSHDEQRVFARTLAAISGKLDGF